MDCIWLASCPLSVIVAGPLLVADAGRVARSAGGAALWLAALFRCVASPKPSEAAFAARE